MHATHIEYVTAVFVGEFKNAEYEPRKC